MAWHYHENVPNGTLIGEYPMLSTLITSKSRVEMLTWFFTHPGERFHYRQLETLLSCSRHSIQIELERLEKAGVLCSRKEGNIRFYWVNQGHPLYAPMKEIVFKTTGLADALKESLGPLVSKIKAAFIYGSVAKNVEDATSDIDVMVIGDVDLDDLHRAIASAEKLIDREVNVSVFDDADFRKQLKQKKAFVTDVVSGPKIFLLGGEDDLR
jgi:predicted nucleotidyltransferase